MRSLSRSSAGFPSANLHTPSGGQPGLDINPVSGYPCQPLEPYSVTARQHSQPVMPTSTHPFFNIQSNTLLVSSCAKGDITRAICGSWANSTLKRYACSSIFVFATPNGSQSAPASLPTNLCFVPLPPLVLADTRVVHLVVGSQP